MSHFETLDNLKDGDIGVIHKFTDDKMASKLLSMGVLPGKSLRLVRRVPFGGGLYIKVEACNLAVRETEAQNIVLEIF
jgi:ferrous iron transport protein A